MIDSVNHVFSIQNHNMKTFENNALNVFWHSEDVEFPEVVQICIMSWIAHGYNVCVWTLDNRRYAFTKMLNSAVNSDLIAKKLIFVKFESYIENKFEDRIYASNKPDGTPGYVTGFADWARYAIAKHVTKVLGRPVIMFDTDVLLLNRLEHSFNFENDVCLVTEESFFAGNQLNGIYPINGMYFDALGDFSDTLEKMSSILLSENKVIKHGTTGPKLVYRMTINDNSLLKDYVPNNQFFELFYDEMHILHEPATESVIRRLSDVTGIHCWMSMLNQHKAVADMRILNIAKNVICQGIVPTYSSLKEYYKANI